MLSLTKLIAPYFIISVLCLFIWSQHINNKRLALNVQQYKTQAQQCNAAVAEAHVIAQQKIAQQKAKIAEAEKKRRALDAETKKQLDQINREDAGSTCQEAIEYGIAKGQQVN